MVGAAATSTLSRAGRERQCCRHNQEKFLWKDGVAAIVPQRGIENIPASMERRRGGVQTYIGDVEGV